MTPPESIIKQKRKASNPANEMNYPDFQLNADESDRSVGQNRLLLAQSNEAAINHQD